VIIRRHGYAGSVPAGKFRPLCSGEVASCNLGVVNISYIGGIRPLAGLVVKLQMSSRWLDPRFESADAAAPSPSANTGARTTCRHIGLERLILHCYQVTSVD
jgi:hypothetical protein